MTVMMSTPNEYSCWTYRNLPLVLTFFILALAVCIVTGCSDSGSSKEAAFIQNKKPIKVVTVYVGELKTTSSIALSGLTEPIHRAAPAARIMARVNEAGFLEGDRVEANRLLIQLDTRDLLANKRQAQAAFNTASTSLDITEVNLKRMSNLYVSKTVSRHQMETAEVAQAQANAAREAARSAIDQLDVSLSYSAVHAPFNGVIVRKMVERGNMVAPGQPLFIIEDDSKLRVIAPVGTDLAATLHPGQLLPVRMGGEMVQGCIEGIVPSGSTEAPGLRVQLIIKNPGHRFKAGTLAVVGISLDADNGTSITIPRASLVEKGRLSGVYVVTKDSIARLHWLILGEGPGDMVNVLSGLQEGERVILSPELAGIRDGNAVVEISK